MFKCDKCGLCCRNIGKSELYKELDRGDGVCRYLRGNLCGIYESRPILCRVDEGYEAFFKNAVSKEEYYALNYKMCEKLKNNKQL